MRPTRGFTLLEVLVALAIFSLASLALSVSIESSMRNSIRLEDKLLATWAADNYLAEARLNQEAFTPGLVTKNIEFAGRKWELTAESQATSNPAIGKIIVRMSEANPGVQMSSQRGGPIIVQTGYVGVAQ